MEKQTFEVFHLRLDKLIRADLPEVVFPNDYQLVARVRAFDIEDAVTLTRSGKVRWWDREGVECVVRSRSTMAMDIVIDERRNRYLVHEEGITRIWPPDRRRERTQERERYPELER